jgi:hypothetical protein
MSTPESRIELAVFIFEVGVQPRSGRKVKPRFSKPAEWTEPTRAIYG